MAPPAGRSGRRAGWRLATALLLGLIGPAVADEAGDFDFYVLSLSWSPSYCADEGRDDRAQCGRQQRPYAFVVHGLWPQYERGFPQFCDTRQRGVDGDTVRRMLDLMPSPGLVRHEWQKHGSCTGLSQGAYFAAMREARAHVTIPPAYRNPERDSLVSPAQVEQAFRQANPSLDSDEIAITCDRRLREVRICMTRDFAFRPCPEVDRRACRASRTLMPRVR